MPSVATRIHGGRGGVVRALECFSWWLVHKSKLLEFVRKHVVDKNTYIYVRNTILVILRKRTWFLLLIRLTMVSLDFYKFYQFRMTTHIQLCICYSAFIVLVSVSLQDEDKTWAMGQIYISFLVLVVFLVLVLVFHF